MADHPHPIPPEAFWAEQVDDNPNRWMGWFTTPRDDRPRPCMHRHHSLQAALACVDARHRAVARAERHGR